jgi:hypothetical protein
VSWLCCGVVVGVGKGEEEATSCQQLGHRLWHQRFREAVLLGIVPGCESSRSVKGSLSRTGRLEWISRSAASGHLLLASTTARETA